MNVMIIYITLKKIEEYSENNCIIYGKHSKILLDWVKVD